MYRTVWVLGAGFSRPLGGPLLPDLFSSGSRARLFAAYGQASNYEHLFSPVASDVRRLYADHGRGGAMAEHHWDDAEQFLEALDAAALHGVGSPAGNLVRELHGRTTPDLDALAVAARRLVAAECCAFLRRADAGSERWAPFRRWLGSLGPNDTVVTFNYDTVVETLAREIHFDGLATLLPGREPDPKKTNLVKLHGSVNWQLRGTRLYVHDDDEFALTCPADEMVIASPGPTKLTIAERLGDLWTAAEASLRAASAVVFIGYRFPPSDASARRRLFSALVQNERPYVAMHTVLGPNRGEDATVRVRSLLLHAMVQAGRAEARRDTGTHYETSTTERSFTLDVHPLYGQDFMDVFIGGHVTQAYRFPRA